MTSAARSALLERLQQAQREQTKVQVIFRGIRAEGTVYRLENDLLQLRQDGRITFIVIESIDALVTE